MTLYYRELIGCPSGQNIIECYRTAHPGDFEGRLGFDLVEVFESYPTLGSFSINDQTAEEAFTFYDRRCGLQRTRFGSEKCSRS
jgi:hypothetical protein